MEVQKYNSIVIKAKENINDKEMKLRLTKKRHNCTFVKKLSNNLIFLSKHVNHEELCISQTFNFQKFALVLIQTKV